MSKNAIAEDTESTMLGATVGNFANRIRRRLKEQELVQDESARASEARQTLILQAMSTIRRALQETAKINLGSRFRFRLDVTDWEGWPRIELNLIDSLQPSNIRFGLVISANDRSEQGTVQLALRSGVLLARLYMIDPKELQRLPLILKKSVRDFLDSIAEYVLKPTDDVHETAPIEISELDTEEDVPQAQLSGDLFSEEMPLSDRNRVVEDEVIPLGAINLELK